MSMRSDGRPSRLPSLAASASAAADLPVVLMPSLGGSLPLDLFEDLLQVPALTLPP